MATKKELIIQGRVENTEEVVSNIMGQVNGEYKPNIMEPRDGKNIAKVMLDLHGKDVRNMCWWEMIDRDNDYQATTEYNGEGVEVKLPWPKVEIAREDRLFPTES